MFRLLILSLILFSTTEGAEPPKRISALYGSLDPRSVSQHLALYELYPNSNEGRQALRRAWQLLSGQTLVSQTSMAAIPLPTRGIHAIVALVNKHPTDSPPQLTEDELSVVDKLSERLPNRKLKGFRAPNEEAVLTLNPHEIDLARGLFLSQLGDTPEALQSLRNYEAMLDLMALQIRAKIDSTTSPEGKIRELNRFVFEEMNFRFPPHSVYAKDIDLYTFLPNVLDTRRGVCLGVSVLYLCLAQRLDVPLEIVTPPGHIYVRYRKDGKEINIETTMRGIHVDSEEYLSLDTRKLQQRDLKETIGFTHINQASVYLQTGQYPKAIAAYEKARPYLPHDPLLNQLMGLSLVLDGQEERGRELLEMVRDYLPDEAVSKDTMVEDYLTGRTDAKGLQALFTSVDETSESLQNKKKILIDCLAEHPHFRTGWLQLGTTHLQMHRYGEALECLEKFHDLCREDVSAEYYLSAIYAERLNFNKAWEHLRYAEQLLAQRDHKPKALKRFRRQLTLSCPEGDLP